MTATETTTKPPLSTHAGVERQGAAFVGVTGGGRGPVSESYIDVVASIAVDDDDNCPSVANAMQRDEDADGIGDECEPDSDGDGVIDDDDNCPSVANTSQTNRDGDWLGDACESDVDSDGVPDDDDNCWNEFNPDQEDRDDDGIGDACDLRTTGCSTMPGGPGGWLALFAVVTVFRRRPHPAVPLKSV